MSNVARRAWRTFALARAFPVFLFLFLFAGLLLVGCKSTGSYRVDWTFDGVAFQPGDCGKYGVSAIAVAGISQDGTVDNPVVACGPGTSSREVPVGTWTLALTALDAEGRIKEPAPSPLLHGQPTTPVVVVADQLTTVPPITLPPLPQCRDGVDNDRDGRVDLDDPECAPFIADATACVNENGLPCP